MPKHPTVLVLTPGLGGDYFGDLLAGLSREIVAADGRLIVVETLQEHVQREGAPGHVRFSLPLAWDEADGVISLTTAVDAAYLERLDATGAPVVLLSGNQEVPANGTTVRPDNGAGTLAAVEHLIDHGHTRIGFVGNLGQRDILDRLHAYREALLAHGLVPEPNLVFDSPENGEPGGVVAAHRVLACDDPPTALMVATDRNAIGLMRTLVQHGLSVPHDVAVAAFDNIAAGAFSSPALTSVEARVDEVGALAGRHIVDRMRGEAIPLATPHASHLVVRESCGCRVGAEYEEDEASASHEDASQQRLLDMLESSLIRDLRTGNEAADRASRETVVAIVGEVASMLARGDHVTSLQIQDLVESLRSLACRPGALGRFADALTSHWPPVGSADAPVTSPAAARIAAAVWKVQAGASLHQAEVTDRAIAEQYTVDAGLLDTEGADPRDLTWLAGTHVNAGVLALWDGGPESGRLTIVGEHRSDGEATLVGTTLRTEAFPPAPLVERATGIDREMCVVIPVRTRERDWGVLALVAPLETTSARETYKHWAALLCAALESQRREEEVRRSALFDALTGLPNRQLFVRQLDQALARRHRDGTPFAVLFMDLDGFKLINDSLGHQMGDKVLMAAGAAINGELRAVDTAARFGGDEFVILLADTDAEHALAAATRIQVALSRVREFDGHEIATRASIGVASSAVDYLTAEDVLRDADSAMYRAKAAEPGSVAFFDEPMHASALERASLATDVLTGINEHQFEVHYQPIVNLATGRTDRFEALLRWRHPERGLLSPDDFLPAISDTSFIVELGHWVLDEVCGQIADWGEAGVNVSINISDKEFWSQDLLRNVLAALGRHGLAPECLTLEVTETILMRRPEMALRMMMRLHDAGLRLHIDDFGTGFSSLETLHRFPVDAFKIDRTFIQTLTTAENSAGLISSLVRLGEALGLAVVAEGVETDEQLEFLRQLGCATGQGYLFMPAVEASEARRLLGHSLAAGVGGSARG